MTPAALREADAARYIGRARNTLRASRVKGSCVPGPAFFKSGKTVLYMREDLDAWLAIQRGTPEGPPAAERPVGPTAVQLVSACDGTL